MLNLSNRPSTKIIILLCLQSLLILLNVLFIFHQAEFLYENAKVINLSRTMRGTFQRAVKLILLGEDSFQVIDQAESLLEDFRVSRPGYTLSGATDEYYGRLNLLENRWNELKVELDRWKDDTSSVVTDRIVALSEVVWDLSDDVVSMGQTVSERERKRLRFGYVFVGLQFVVMLGVVWLVFSAVRSRLEPQATRDSLTGLFNRRVYDEMLPRLVAMASRYMASLSLISFDLDHFKTVNDTLGHAAGDEVLRRVAQVVSAHIRSSDMFCRVGGEEFIILCPHTDKEQALILAEKLCSAVRSADMSPAKNVTISLGVAALRSQEEYTELMERVDRRLYKAKQTGRDRVVSESE